MSLNLKTPLIAAGWNGKLLTHVMPWVGDGHVHRAQRYSSNDQYAVKAQLDNMQAVGIDGVIMTWQGPFVGVFGHEATKEMAFQCSQRGMLFALLLDPGLLRYRPDTTNPIETSVINALNDPGVQEMFHSGAYVPEKFVFDFLTGYSVNWATVAAAVPGITPMKRHVDYSWPEITNVMPTLIKDNSSPTMRVPGVFYGFDDAGCPLPYGVQQASLWNGQRDYSQSVWSGTPGTQPARVIDHQAGNTYLDSVAAVPKLAPYAAIVTWNDHDEGTGIEQYVSMFTGIRIGR